MRSARSTKMSAKCKNIQLFHNNVAVDDWDDEPVQQNASTQGRLIYLISYKDDWSAVSSEVQQQSSFPTVHPRT